MRQLLFMITAILSLNCSSQTSIKGKISSDKKLPMDAVSIALLQAKDSVLIQGCLSESDGSYKLTQISKGDYRMLISRMGYEKILSDIIHLKEEQQELIQNFSLQPNSKFFQ